VSVFAGSLRRYIDFGRPMIKGHSAMRGLIAAAALAVAVLLPGRAAGFDYFLLALSWSPSWCLSEGDPGAAQCAPERDLEFVLHGLWPQFEEGWPKDCASDAPDPSRREAAAMADVMGSAGLAAHQWRRHGRCTGLDAAAYFALSRQAFERVALPELDGPMTAAAVEAAFRAANPDLGADQLVATCRDGLLREVRLCLTRALAPRACGADVERAACRALGLLAVPPAP